MSKCEKTTNPVGCKYPNHFSDTYVPGTNGQTNIGLKTPTTPGTGFPGRDRLSFPLPVWVRSAHTVSRVIFYIPCWDTIICVL